VDNASDVTTEGAGEGTDTVESSVTRTLGSNLENLILTGTAAISGTGNALANVLTGNGAGNTLNGGGGADTMSGGAGDDIYVVDNTGDVIVEGAGEGVDLVQSSVNYTLSGGVENLTLTGSSSLSATGNELDNLLTGNSGANTLSGGAGNDTLDGGAGSDTMIGGAGDDTYLVGTAGDVVTESANEGVDTVLSSVTYTLGNNLENLTLSGASAINGTGNALNNVLRGNSANNTLTGGAGNDLLDGGSGSDTMLGGTGDDTYVVNVSTDVVTENANEGIDTVQSSVTLTLTSNVEHLTLTGTSAVNGTGNSLNNYLRGNAANNTLNGGGGNDVLQGAAGNDTLTDTSGNNALDGGDGTDSVNGGTGREFVAGGVGADTLKLGGGADIIAFNRGHGADTVTAPTSGAGLNETNDTISIGGVRYGDLRLARSGNDLLIKVAGTSDSLKLANWYAASGNRTMTTLQFIVDSTTDYNVGSSDNLVNRRVVRLNFTTLVNAFNSVYSANPSVGDWAIPSATLATAYVAGSDSQAVGGDLAYRYGRDGNLSGLDFSAAAAVLGNANFATSAQAFSADPVVGGVQLLSAGLTTDEPDRTKRRQDDVLKLAEQWVADSYQSGGEVTHPFLTIDMLDGRATPQPADALPLSRLAVEAMSDVGGEGAPNMGLAVETGHPAFNSISRRWVALDALLSQSEVRAMPALGGEDTDAWRSQSTQSSLSMSSVLTAIKPRQSVRENLH
jgi:Ca2+-binding RTX toxin-like protein